MAITKKNPNRCAKMKSIIEKLELKLELQPHMQGLNNFLLSTLNLGAGSPVLN